MSAFSSFVERARVVFLGAPSASAADDTAPVDAMPALKPVISGGSATDTVDSSHDSLSATTGSLRISTEDIVYPTNDTISVYEVKKGDTLATVAKLFGVSKNTIIWANDLKSQTLVPGTTLVILPITGVKHTVRDGDTVATIAKKYKGDVEDIAKYNGIAPDAELVAGDVVIVPEGEIEVPVAPRKRSRSLVHSKLIETYTNATQSGFLIRPLVGGHKTQGLHGHNAIDIGAPIGTPILASASGVIIVARSYGYNGGYGSMIVISHEGNIQTVYAHLSRVDVSSGEQVAQGQVIGALGNTGRSTGPHLHFEVRGAKNPF